MGAQLIFTSDDNNYNITQSASIDPSIGEMQLKSIKYSSSKTLQNDSTVAELISVKKSIETMPGGLSIGMMICSLCSNSTVSNHGSPSSAMTSEGKVSAPLKPESITALIRRRWPSGPRNVSRMVASNAELMNPVIIWPSA